MKGTGEGSSVFSGALWLLSGSAAQSVLKAVVTAILARLLSPEDFGLVAAAMAVIALVNMINGAGTGSFLVQKSEVTDDHYHTVFSYSILAGALSAGLVLLLRHWIAAFFNMPRLSTVITLLVLIFLFQSLYRVSYTYLQRNMMFREMAGLDLLSYLVAYGVLGTGLAYAGYGVWALAIAAVAQSFFFSVLLFWRVPLKLKFLIKKDILKEATVTGSGFSAINLLAYAARQGDYWIVGNMLGAASLGYYSRAFSLMTAPHSIMGSALNKVLFAKFARLQHESEKLRLTLKRTVALIFFLGIPLSAFFILLAPELVLLLLGPDWKNTVLPLQILSVALVAKTSVGLLANYLLGQGLLKSGFKIYLLYSLLIVAGAITGVASTRDTSNSGRCCFHFQRSCAALMRKPERSYPLDSVRAPVRCPARAALRPGRPPPLSRRARRRPASGCHESGLSTTRGRCGRRGR